MDGFLSNRQYAAMAETRFIRFPYLLFNADIYRICF